MKGLASHRLTKKNAHICLRISADELPSMLDKGKVMFRFLVKSPQTNYSFVKFPETNYFS